MKIIKNNANFPLEVKCPMCTSELEVDIKDLYYERGLSNALSNYSTERQVRYTKCPCCGARINIAKVK